MKIWAVFLVVDADGRRYAELLALYRLIKDAHAAYSSAIPFARERLYDIPSHVTHIIDIVEVQ